MSGGRGNVAKLKNCSSTIEEQYEQPDTSIDDVEGAGEDEGAGDNSNEADDASSFFFFDFFADEEPLPEDDGFPAEGPLSQTGPKVPSRSSRDKSSLVNKMEGDM